MTGAVSEAVPAELSPKEQRKLREQARREAAAKFKAAEVERLTQAEAAKRGTPAPAKGAAAAAASEAAQPVTPDRTDADRVKDAAAFLRGVLLPVVAVFAPLFGYRLDLAQFTEALAAEDARAWVPLARRYRTIDLLITWAGAPARLVARVRELAKRREEVKAS